MKIRMRLSGGFAGLTREARVDLAATDGATGLDESARAPLEACAHRLWAAHAVAAAPQPQATPDPGATRDAEYCEIELHHEGVTVQFAAPVQNLGADARCVLGCLRALARPVRPV